MGSVALTPLPKSAAAATRANGESASAGHEIDEHVDPVEGRTQVVEEPIRRAMLDRACCETRADHRDASSGSGVGRSSGRCGGAFDGVEFAMVRPAMRSVPVESVEGWRGPRWSRPDPAEAESRASSTRTFSPRSHDLDREVHRLVIDRTQQLEREPGREHPRPPGFGLEAVGEQGRDRATVQGSSGDQGPVASSVGR